MDEVNVKSDISYKGGKIIGSFNSDKATELFFALWSRVYMENGQRLCVGYRLSQLYLVNWSLLLHIL